MCTLHNDLQKKYIEVVVFAFENDFQTDYSDNYMTKRLMMIITVVMIKKISLNGGSLVRGQLFGAIQL